MNRSIYHVEVVVHHYEEKDKLIECVPRVTAKTVNTTLEGAFYRRVAEHRLLREDNRLATTSAHIVDRWGERF